MRIWKQQVQIFPYDSVLDIEVAYDHLFSWVASVMPQYNIEYLKKMPIHKFMRLTYEAENRQLEKKKALRGGREKTIKMQR